MRSVKPADFPPQVIRCSAWPRILQAIPHRATVNPDESLANGFDRGDTTCECGLATENTAHMMQCTLLAEPCSLDDLNKFNDTAKKMRGKMENTSLMTHC